MLREAVFFVIVTSVTRMILPAAARAARYDTRCDSALRKSAMLFTLPCWRYADMITLMPAAAADTMLLFMMGASFTPLDTPF